MLHLTQQEKCVVLIIVCVVFVGSSVNYALKIYPGLSNFVNLMDEGCLYHKLDLNSSTSEELQTIPYIGEYTSREIVFYREANGPFERVEDVKKVRGIRDKNFEKFKHYLMVR